MATKLLEVPFDHKGNQLHWAVCGSDVVWKPNYEFCAPLTLLGFTRGRSSAYTEWTSEKGKTFTCFLSSLEHILLTYRIQNGEVDGCWTFCKKGNNFSLKLLGGKHLWQTVPDGPSDTRMVCTVCSKEQFTIKDAYSCGSYNV